MENLQKFAPLIQEQLQQWYDLTLHNQEYAAFLALSVWLLLAIFYSIRIGFLKRGHGKTIKAKQEIQASLEAAQAELQTLQQQLAETQAQTQAAEQKLEAESQRAVSLQQSLTASNQQLAGSLMTLVEAFELSHSNLPNAEAGNLLTEYQAIQARVVERFQNEQQAKTQLQLSFHAESAKLAEKEMLVSSLQHRLDTQTQQLAKLEMAIEQYEAAQLQLQADKEQMALEMSKRQAQAVKAAEPAPAKAEAFIPASAPVQPAAVAPEPVAVKFEAPKAAEIKPEQAAPAKPEPVVAAKPQPAPAKAKAAGGGKFKGLFGKAMDKISKMDEKFGPQTGGGEPAKTEAEVSTPAPVAAEAVKEPVVVETPAPTPAEPAAEKADKSGGLFGGFKKAAKPAAVEPPAAEPVPAETETAEPEAHKAKAGGQLSGLLGKFKLKK